MAGDNVIVAVRVRPPPAASLDGSSDWVVRPELQEGDEDARTTAIVTQNPGNGDIRQGSCAALSMTCEAYPATPTPAFVRSFVLSFLPAITIFLVLLCIGRTTCF